MTARTSDPTRPDAVIARGPDLTDRLAYLVQDDLLHRTVYTDPELFDLEMQRVFGGSWVFLAHESEIPEAGDYVRRQMGKRQILIVRTEHGEVKGLLNRCTHRGTTLVPSEAGCAKRFVCPYHGWAFDLDGRIANLPVSDSYDRLHERPFDLGQVAIGIRAGFIFGTLAADPMPVDDWLGAAGPWLDLHVARYPGGRLKVQRRRIVQEFAANWKMSWDNAADGIHATFAHASYNTLGKSADTKTVLARNPAVTPMVSRTLGHGHCVVDQRPGIPDGPWSTMRPLPTRAEIEASLRERGETRREMFDLMTGDMINLSIFPNLIFVGNQIMVPEPVAPDRTRVAFYLTMAPEAPEEVDLMRLRVDEDFLSFGTPDDFEMFERVQEGLRVDEEEWIDISRGTGAGDVTGEDGLVTGTVASEAPMRAYLAEWKRLMSKPVPTTVRRARIEESRFMQTIRQRQMKREQNS
ncbi:aromatic ring-hydroxylating oxygenase subunit alpha [Celeribacter indicus]|uniref:Rieske (2Fe-2S) domain-containing protein n=1 Tax=Celeribacter indicus TaxID=1208324 RepID=A0A0B5E1G8_9RHOB|nr:aromatic ring-hydroxylating dioxygenase subunit alpha [Celeribacter indicus]AJE46866.1 Rieske (2Fe-2S) domain-containing protein [Celeribacter indicus]SDW79924.1 Phenylpropionate dioxygenase, large terminal subunit [Celeribacter indicus]